MQNSYQNVLELLLMTSLIWKILEASPPPLPLVQSPYVCLWHIALNGHTQFKKPLNQYRY